MGMHEIAFQPKDPHNSRIFTCHSNIAWNVTKVKKYIQVSCTTFINIWIQSDISTTFCDERPLSRRTAPSRPGGDVICCFLNCSHRRSVTSTTHKGATKDCNKQTAILKEKVWDRKSANCRPFLYHSRNAHLRFVLGGYGMLTLLDYIALYPRR